LAAAAGDQRGELAAARLVADRVDVGDVLRDHAERAALGGKSGNARIHRSIEAHALVSIAFLVKPEPGPFCCPVAKRPPGAAPKPPRSPAPARSRSSARARRRGSKARSPFR